MFSGVAWRALAALVAPRAAHAGDRLRREPPPREALSMAGVVVEGLVSESRPDAFVLDVVTVHKGAPRERLRYRFKKGDRVLVYAPQGDGGVEVAQCRAGVGVVWGDEAARESKALRARDAGR